MQIIKTLYVARHKDGRYIDNYFTSVNEGLTTSIEDALMYENENDIFFAITDRKDKSEFYSKKIFICEAITEEIS